MGGWKGRGGDRGSGVFKKRAKGGPVGGSKRGPNEYDEVFSDPTPSARKKGLDGAGGHGDTSSRTDGNLIKHTSRGK